MTVVESRKGFIAIIVVLMLTLALVTTGAFVISKVVKPQKVKATRNVVSAARDTIIGFAIANKRLPSQAEFVAIRRSSDEWGNSLQYFSADVISGPAGTSLCSTVPATFLAITDMGTAIPNGAFTVYSRGLNATDETNTGPFTFVIQAPSDAYDDLVEYMTLTDLRRRVCHEMRITTESLPVGMEEVSYSPTTLEATDGTTPYTWTVAAGSLPNGLALAPNGSIVGTPNPLILIPAVAGTFNFTAQVRDSEARVAQKSLVITVNPNGPRITTGFLHNGTAGHPYSAPLSATGGNPGYSYTHVGGSLPPGLSISGNALLGTIDSSASGAYDFIVRVSDSRGRTSDRRLSLSVGSSSTCTTLTNTTPSPLPSGTRLQFYITAITYTGGEAPVSCNIVSGNLPPGLWRLGCWVFGWPTAFGTYTFTTRVTDSCSPTPQVSDKATSITIAYPGVTGWSSSLPTANNCESYSGSISVLGGYSPYTWSSISGSLPSGIDFCTGNTTDTCSLTGTVLSAPGTYNFTTQVTDSAVPPQTTSNGFSITVSDSCYAGGMRLYNANNAYRHYRITGDSTCYTWAAGTYIPIVPGTTYEIFRNSNNCTAPCSYVNNITPNYCDMKSVNTDADCDVQMNVQGNRCIFSNR